MTDNWIRQLYERYIERYGERDSKRLAKQRMAHREKR